VCILLHPGVCMYSRVEPPVTSMTLWGDRPLKPAGGKVDPPSL
jgi:hypothetical protein